MNNNDVLFLIDETQDDLNRVNSIVDSIGKTSNPVPYLNKYSIIKACGAIEVAYKKIICDFCKRRSKSQVKNFLDKKMRKDSRSPSYGNVCNFLVDFDKNWKNEFTRRIDSHPIGAKIKTSLDSLSEARNEFAHGGNPSATVSNVIGYFADCRIALEIIDDIVS